MSPIVDKVYCMSSFLTFRCVVDDAKIFREGLVRHKNQLPPERYVCKTSDDVDEAIRDVLRRKVDDRTGLMLSGGMDSAILATYLPEGTKAYTMRCAAEGSADETERAKYWAEKCKLDHKVVEVHWQDYLDYAPALMKNKHAPMHSIEVLIYKMALQAKQDGLTKLVSGEGADSKFGGLDGVFAKDWTFDEFVNRYTYVQPKRALKEFLDVLEPYHRYWIGGRMDVHHFISDFCFFTEYIQSYLNSCSLAGIEFIAPYGLMEMGIPLDVAQVRSGNSKYLIRDLFARKYPNAKPAVKLPMPKAMTQWLADWPGPQRAEFQPGCANGLTGDQRWLIYCLEWFLNLMDEGKLD